MPTTPLPQLPADIATPAYVLDMAALKRNLSTAARVSPGPSGTVRRRVGSATGRGVCGRGVVGSTASQPVLMRSAAKSGA